MTDSVFSMDGDIAPLEEIVELAQAPARAWSSTRRTRSARTARAGGACSHRQGLEDEVDAIVGTLGKALGSYGAYVCGDEETVRYLLNTSRSLIFSTAPAAARARRRAGRAGAARGASTPRRAAERERARAASRARGARASTVAEGDMHIVPLVVGEERQALRLCQEAIERGVFAQAIRPPTVPAGTSRLRLAAMASHTATDMRTGGGGARGGSAQAGPRSG